MKSFLTLSVFLCATLFWSDVKGQSDLSSDNVYENFVTPFQVTIYASDLSSSINWYQTALSTEIIKQARDTKSKRKFAVLGGSNFIIKLIQADEGHWNSELNMGDDAYLCCFNKIGFVATKFSNLTSYYTEHNIEMHIDPFWDKVSNLDYIRLEDPDKNIIEIIPGADNGSSEKNIFRFFKMGLFVDDLEKSVSWYEQHLGLIFYRKLDFTEEQIFIRFLRSDNFILELDQISGTPCTNTQVTDKTDKKFPGIHMVSFKVNDLEGLAKFLEAKEASFLEPISDCKSSWATKCTVIADKCGNQISFLD